MTWTQPFVQSPINHQKQALKGPLNYPSEKSDSKNIILFLIKSR